MFGELYKKEDKLFRIDIEYLLLISLGLMIVPLKLANNFRYLWQRLKEIQLYKGLRIPKLILLLYDIIHIKHLMDISLEELGMKKSFQFLKKMKLMHHVSK